MSRYNPNSVLLNLLHTMQSKETQYKEEIKNNHVFSNATASRLVPDGGGIEQTLLMLAASSGNDKDPIVTKEQVQEFLQEQRNRLKNIAKENVQDTRTVDNFLNALRTMKTQIEKGEPLGNHDAPEENGDDMEIEDFSSILQQLMETSKVERQADLLPLEQEKFYRDICTTMGETVSSSQGHRKTGNGEDDDDDDEIEVMRTGTQTSKLKCPITTMLLEHPVRNKVCGHTYSRDAIYSYLRASKRQCPVPGCNNHMLSESSLEEDRDMEVLIRRERRRQELESQQRAPKSELVDSDEENF